MRERRESGGRSIIGQIWNAIEAPRSSRSWLPPRMGEKLEDLVDEQKETGEMTNITRLWHEAPVYERMFAKRVGGNLGDRESSPTEGSSNESEGPEDDARGAEDPGVESQSVKLHEPQLPTAFLHHMKRARALKKIVDRREHRNRIAAFLYGFECFKDRPEVTYKELEAALRHYGSSTKFVDYLLANADMDGNGKITLQEYLRLKADTMTSHQLYLSALFERIDEDNDGEVTFDEFRKALKELDDGMPDSEIEWLFNDLDENQDRLVDYKEFTTWFMEKQS